ncbi:hypothetical protein MBESOW_P1215 [Sphingobium xenophagum]|uniref:Uncharacterized protein n=1 Tax=Sphingobium xenophagum TaxID=121428 RepID=A0A401J004_SPHXE|nr:hypothetical protein MBESOW_P1215 [Sphingobium xenophagum]
MLNGNSGWFRLSAVTLAGMVVESADKRCELPWRAVQGISAGRVQLDNEIWHLALAADIDREWSARLVIVTEADRIWARFTQVLPQVFPCVSSVTTWGPQALTTPEPISLYDRPSRDSYWLGAETRLQ